MFLVFILCTDDVAKCFEENVRIYVNFNFKFKLYKEKKVDEAKFFLFFLWCLFKKTKTFQLERRVAEVQLLSPFSHVGK